MGQLLNIGGIECAFHIGPDGSDGGIVENYMLDSGPEARCTFMCDWLDRQYLVQALLGTVVYNNGTITRTDPFSYPLDQNLLAADGNDQVAQPDRWICTGIGPVRGIKWRTDDDGSITNTGIPGWGYYSTAVMEAVFTVPLWTVDSFAPGTPGVDLSGQSYVVTKTRTSGEVFAPPTNSIIYGGGKFAGRPLADINASIVRTRMEISLTLIRFPLVPFNSIMGIGSAGLGGLIGSVNAKPITFGTYQFPKGSILLTGSNSDPKPDPCSFEIVQDVEITFLANGPASSFQQNQMNPLLQNLDWNYFLDPSGTWVPCTFNVDPPLPVFAYEDFSQLFQAAIS